jgi:hypothetical protein
MMVEVQESVLPNSVPSTEKGNNSARVGFAATFVVLLLVLFIRVTRGLDLTDEMQYYGQLKGLLETGRLFTNDLFIQQLVYVLLYPLFYVYRLAFGFEGIVFFGRLIMAVLSVAVFLYSYKKLREFGFSSIVASLAAFSLTFAIPYHGIFAPSYNTISQILWIVFMLRFFEWKRNSMIIWGALPVVMMFAHPTSGVIMSLVVIVRLLLGHELKNVVYLVVVLFVGAMIDAAVLLLFASPQEYLRSLTFSNGDGLGSVFLSSRSEPTILLVIYATFAACLLFWKHFRKVDFALITSSFVAIAIVLFVAGEVGWGYSSLVVCILSGLNVLVFGWLLANLSDNNIDQKNKFLWFVVMLLVYATTLLITSGNGMGQATGAFMVGLPLLLGFSVSMSSKRKSVDTPSFSEIYCVVLVCVLFAAQWMRFPYREDYWWRANNTIQTVPEFRFMSSSQERVGFIQRMRDALEPVAKGKRALIISEIPGLYVICGAHAETGMLYMHPTAASSEDLLLEFLNEKKPEVVIDVFVNNDMGGVSSRMKNIMHNYYSQRGFMCEARNITFETMSWHNPAFMIYSVCTQRGLEVQK